MLFKLEHLLPADINHAWSIIMSEEFFPNPMRSLGFKERLRKSVTANSIRLYR